MDNLCIMCGAIIPEGLLVCPICERKVMHLKPMTYDRMLELLEIEHQCSQSNCNRNCAMCELSQNADELDQMYTMALNILRRKA